MPFVTHKNEQIWLGKKPKQTFFLRTCHNDKLIAVGRGARESCGVGAVFTHALERGVGLSTFGALQAGDRHAGRV